MNFIENIKLFLNQINIKQEQIIARFMFNKSMTISVAESCTGGLISSRLTDIPGSSAYIKENYITYSNDAKIKLLGVSRETLNQYGAVSEECAREMAEGLFKKVDCDISLVTTGIAGPEGYTDIKKIGLIYVGIKNKYTTQIKKIQINYPYKRKRMKFAFSQKALELLIDFINENYKD